MKMIYLNNIIYDKANDDKIQIINILNKIDLAINKNNIVKMNIYYTNNNTYENIISIIKDWKPTNLIIEYLGNYSNYNSSIQVMASVIAETPLQDKNPFEKVNYII